MSKKSTTEQFIEKSKNIQKIVYGYNEVKYEGNRIKVKIECFKHGFYFQIPHDHLRGAGCPKCGGSEKLTTKIFIERAIKLNGNEYDYSKSKYINCDTKVIIICKIHGEFLQTPDSHFRGAGCPDCYGTKILTTETFKKRAIKLNGNKFGYDKVEYVTAKIRVAIECFKHGIFLQLPFSHLNGNGCQKCYYEEFGKRQTSTKEKFIEKAIKKHNDKNNYDKVIYVSAKIKVEIICNKCGGIYWQTPDSHLSGQGCPKCASSQMENKGINFCKQNNIIYEIQKTFQTCKDKRVLKFDLYIPNQIIKIGCNKIELNEKLIEFDGRQHFEVSTLKSRKDTQEKLDDRIKKDNIKNLWAQNNNIPLLRISYKESKNIDTILQKEIFGN